MHFSFNLGVYSFLNWKAEFFWSIKYFIWSNLKIFPKMCISLKITSVFSEQHSRPVSGLFGIYAVA